MKEGNDWNPKDHISFSTKIRAVKRHLAPFTGALVLVSALGLLSAVANGTVPLLVGRFLDTLISGGSVMLPYFGEVPLWSVLLGAWVFAQLVANVTDWVIGYQSRIIGTRLQANYIIDAYSKLLRLPVSFFKEQKSGELSELVNRVSWMLDTIVGSVLITLAPQFLSIMIGTAIAFSLQPSLAVVLLAGVVIYLISLVILLRPVAGMQARGHRMWREAYGSVSDAYTNLQTVKQAGAEEFEERKSKDAFFKPGGAVSVWKRLEVSWNNLNAFQRVVIVLTQLVIFLMSVSLIAQGQMTLGELIAFNAYAGLIFGPFVALGNQWQTVQNGLTAAAQAEVIFETTEESYSPEGAEPLGDLKGDVQFDNVHFAYSEKDPEVLSGVSFTAHAGELIALVGETGAGKSTTADLISGYYYPTRGEVRIDGHDTKKLSLRELRAHVAIVPQEVVLFNTSIMDNIRYGRPNATDEEVQEAARRARADVFIEKFPEGYTQLVGERGIKLSVGQKQRVAIARAILRDPRILVLDEPTSALDAQTEAYITKSLEELMQGRTTFVIAHRLSTVRKADKILVLEHGKIIEMGRHDELVNKEGGAYRRLYELNIGLHE